MNKWSLLPAISAPMPFQMALDEILLRNMTGPGPFLGLNQKGAWPPQPCPPILRFYFSSEPWVTVGYSCHFDDRREEKSGISHLRLEMTGSRSLPVCRRITGGGRVEHGRDLIFSLVARKTADESFKAVRASYLKIHEAVKAGLEAVIGVRATGRSPLRFYRCNENLPKGTDCFRFPIATDLALNGRKIAGGAQKRSAGVFLHQESIQPVNGFAPEDLIPAVRKGVEKVFGVEIENVDLDPTLLDEAGHSPHPALSPFRQRTDPPVFVRTGRGEG